MQNIDVREASRIVGDIKDRTARLATAAWVCSMSDGKSSRFRGVSTDNQAMYAVSQLVDRNFVRNDGGLYTLPEPQLTELKRLDADSFLAIAKQPARVAA